MSSDQSSPDARATNASFTIEMMPGDPALDSTSRFDFTKIWSGGLVGTSRGVMLSAGDPQNGNAGYVAIEVFNGHVDGRQGALALQQFGTMHNGEYALRYEVVPGSATNELVGIAGEIDLTIEDGEHSVVFRYRR